MKSQIKMIIGLGNPGKNYENTYHNAGFSFLDYLNRAPGTWHLASGKILKSDQFMNESGAFVKKALEKRGVKPENLLVVHDDSDIELGKYKLAFDRGAAGHHGIESIVKTLGTQKFWRLRIGIRNPKNKKGAEDFVLRKMGSGEKDVIRLVFEKVIGSLIDK